jgi:hypothetical protein
MCDLTIRRQSGWLELCEDDSTDPADELRLQNLTVVIDQVVETTSGDFATARTMLEQMPAEPDGGGDNHSSPGPFFHEIGELKLMAEVRPEAATLGKSRAELQAHEHETRRKAVAAACATQLEAFMSPPPALFPMTPRPRGKLVAYFSCREKRAAAAR